LLQPEKIKVMIKKVVQAEGMELVGFELKGPSRQRILRVFIDKRIGINHDDCMQISNQLGPVLDVEETIKGRYTLEVSSPGLTRRLQTREEFEHFKGRQIRVRTTIDLDESKNFLGILTAIKGEAIKLSLKNSSSVVIPLKIIGRAQLVIDF
jgi:ribosome maturation factor RimP